MNHSEQEQLLHTYLKKIYGSDATFRNGQKEAIQAVLSGTRTLVVQKTGWGKSLVYFLATRVLRDMGRGFTVVISPLLALMNNQIDAAQRLGLRAVSINSQNQESWKNVANDIANNKIDVLFISPERLSNEDFMSDVLNRLSSNIGMLVVDEAHCISDWGHDFRPDYKKIVNVIRVLPSSVPFLATTATANDRVIKDICDQMGQNIHLLRGTLSRESLYIQVIHLSYKEERLAWLAENLNQMDGSGIVYCLTKGDCRMISEWLCRMNISAFAYTGDMDTEQRRDLEQRFLNNQMKVLVATVAYGMGIDKPDISFVIHFQKPGNVVAYYQQIGRAGRAIARAHAVLLNGAEDDEIIRYFIQSAFPTYREMDEVIRLLESGSGFGLYQLLAKVNQSKGRLEKALKFLAINGDIYKEDKKYYKSPKKWDPDFSYSDNITSIRENELSQMNTFVGLGHCYMEFVATALNDENAHPCGHCGNCMPSEKFPETVSRELVFEAQKYLRSGFYTIEPRKKWPVETKIDGKSSIKEDETYQQGCALSNYGDAGWGRMVSHGKYRDNHFSTELVDASALLLKDKCVEWEIQWVTAVPSRRRPELVRGFAVRLASELGLPYYDALIKIGDSPEQKGMQNSHGQCSNAYKSFETSQVCEGNVLLIDDMVDSRWTLTVCAYKLIKSGVDKVFPFALANTSGSGGTDS